MAVNKHGLKLKNLKWVCGMSKSIGTESTEAGVLVYNIRTGELTMPTYIRLESARDFQRWMSTSYDHISKIIYSPMTMQEIAEWVYCKVNGKAEDSRRNGDTSND